MKDSELRGLVLQYFYDNRRKHSVREPKAADLGVEVTEEDILHICAQLRDHNLINWHAVNIQSMTIESWGKSVVHSLGGSIKTFGIDVVESAENGIDIVEGTVSSAIKIKFVQYNNTVTITDSTGVSNIIGSNNTLTKRNS